MNIIDPCPLCGQAVKIKGFSLKTKEGNKSFCCAGCASIYELLNQDKLITTKEQEEENESL